MSVIAPAERVGANTFEYLVGVQRHAAHIAEHPERWMPWNYLEALADIAAPSPGPELAEP